MKPSRIRCPDCKDGGRLTIDGKTSSGEPRYWCRKCNRAWSVTSTRRPAERNPGMRAIEEGFIPWGVLDPEVKKAYAEAGMRLRRGQGPGSSAGRATKLLGMKPCRGCRGRIEALDDLGWLPVLLYTGAVAGFTFTVQWLMS